MSNESVTTESIYRVVFHNQGSVYEVYARHVSQGGLYGFVEVEELLFGERSSVVLDPSEEKLKTEFDGVQRFHVPMHAVIRIDEVKRKGTPRITKAEEAGGEVTPFPVVMPPAPKPSKS